MSEQNNEQQEGSGHGQPGSSAVDKEKRRTLKRDTRLEESGGPALRKQQLSKKARGKRSRAYRKVSRAVVWNNHAWGPPAGNSAFGVSFGREATAWVIMAVL